MPLLERAHRELRYALGLLGILRAVRPLTADPSRTVGQLIENLAERYGDKIALLSDHESLSYKSLNERSNRYARFALAQGLRPGDTVALLMPNRAEYLCAWTGFAKAGCVTALINTNLVGPALSQCINVAHPRIIVVDASLHQPLLAVASHLSAEAQIFVHGAIEATEDSDHGIDAALAQIDGGNLEAKERPALASKDRCLYVYTSGTTGLPKAANLNHFRVLLMMTGFAAVTRARASDRIYDCLPMYHTVGGIAAVGAALIQGATLVIREKFSARDFWQDIAKFECTVFCYVGELCRYLLAAPPSPHEGSHRLRLCCGNGLRPDVWTRFTERFQIPRVLEFYAATEGNVALFNFDATPGAVGRLPDWIKHRFPIAIVRFDIETEQPLRDANGFCLRCGPGETGQILGEIITDPKKPANRFEGYSDKAASERKILRNVFKPGDAWFSTGDLMSRDARGYYFFHDRAGDTFRWKGENVSTTQVSEIVTAFAGVQHANVYGVSVPGTEGRAGMTALVVEDETHFDLAGFRQHLADNLPAFARPLFLRFQDHADVTSTFKQRKVDLVAQGFDPSACGDRIFFDDSRAAGFVRIDAALYAQIAQGTLRL